MLKPRTRQRALGIFLSFHPHIHALVTEGVFLPEGTFLTLLKLATLGLPMPVEFATLARNG